MVFNPSKFTFGRQEVDFAGFTVTDDGVKPTRKMLEAIRGFPKPINLTGARAWFGLVNQVAFSFAQTEEMAPFRGLLKRNSQFFWDDNMDYLFEKSKGRVVELVEEGVSGTMDIKCDYMVTPKVRREREREERAQRRRA